MCTVTSIDLLDADTGEAFLDIVNETGTVINVFNDSGKVVEGQKLNNLFYMLDYSGYVLTEKEESISLNKNGGYDIVGKVDLNKSTITARGYIFDIEGDFIDKDIPNLSNVEFYVPRIDYF